MNNPRDVPLKGHASTHFLNRFFFPESVIIVGASPRPDNLGGRIVQSLLANQYSGRILAIHPEPLPIGTVPALESLEQVTGSWDLAIAAVSASHVPALIEPLSRKGVQNLIVISGGFAEVGEEGNRLQEQLKEQGKRFGVRIIGPNGLGVFCASSRFNSLFLSPDEVRMPKAGPVAMISQSGAFLSLVLNRLAEKGTGVSYAVNFGNRVDVDECDLLEWYSEDPSISTIGIYLESVANGPRLIQTAHAVSKKKPILILKGGQTPHGILAAHSHTAALAGSYDIFKAACEKSGILMANGLEDFLTGLQTLALQPPARGNRALIVSNGGGMGVFLTDLSESQGLDISPPPEEIQTRLRQGLPGYYSLKNPIDLTGSGTNAEFLKVVETLSTGDLYDLILLVPMPGTQGITPELAEGLSTRVSPEKPVLLATYGTHFVESFTRILLKDTIPVFSSAEDAVMIAGHLVQRGKFKSLTTSPTTEYAGDKTFDSPRDEWELKNTFVSAGFNVPDRIRLDNNSDLPKAASTLGSPLVLKRAATDILHKKKEGDVVLNITSAESLAEHFAGLITKNSGIVFAEKQVPDGVDLFLGVTRDPVFGPVMVFGLGGNNAELFRDVAHWILPATQVEFEGLISKPKVGQYLGTLVENWPQHRDTLLKLMGYMAHQITGLPAIHSLELNPVRILKKQTLILDAKIIYAPPRSY